MKEKMKKALEYVNGHKKQIGLVVAATAGGAVLYKTGLHAGIKYAITNANIDYDISGVRDCITCEDGQWWIGRNGIALSDMGKLGEDIREAIPDITENVIISTILIPAGEAET